MPISQRLVVFSTLLTLGIFMGSCSGRPAGEPLTAPRFELLDSRATGLNFTNELRQSTELNVFNYMYFFNGGGVAAGDFNQDGLVDLYFTSNMGPNALFLNQGGFKFEEVTEKAGVAGQKGWTSGVSIVDINNDGLLDIYVSQLGDYLDMKGKNQLYVCQGLENGIPVYTDQAAYYGLDLVGFSTQGAFFDYDLDGDLDLFQLNHSLHQNGTFGQKKSFAGSQHPLAGDKLMRNDDGQFVEVTLEAGINSSVIGYGLGVATGDVNLDGWPDIYVGNDFHENDYLYINQQDGTFREVLTDQIRHTSRFSMGVDIADINNDGWSEILSLDMLPSDPYILKTSLGEDGYNIFQFKLGYGYNPQFSRNNLQLNNGNNSFSEIGMFSGLYASDWSWAPLFLDFDQDGYKDVFISNGIPRRMNDIDYIRFKSSDENLEWKSSNDYIQQEDLSIVDKMPRVKLENKFFLNNRDLTFADLAQQIRNDKQSYSQGAVYADLDNDGDLDIVVNNLEDPPFVYQNLTSETPAPQQGYLHFQFHGPPANINGVGARVVIRKAGEILTYEHFPVRGYQSSVAPGLNIGIGDAAQVEKVWVIWPDRTFEEVGAPAFNQSTTLEWRAGLPAFDFGLLQKKPSQGPLFFDATAQLGLNFTHKENPFVEFNREGLIPHMVSAEGPALAVGDVNGDGLEDVFLGGSKGEKSALFLQKPNGTFVDATHAAFEADRVFEDVDAVFADLENDGDLDLVIAAGGNEFRGQSEALKQRVYLNDGKGGFQRADPFPGVFITASCVLPTDLNGDGLVDFFFGGRAVTSNYGIIPDSYLFLNQGGGMFKEVTDQYSPDLKKAGLVKDGTWFDIDQDGDEDLLLAVEWEAPTIYVNQGGRLEKRTVGEWKGWWNFLLPTDVDQDGDVDIIAGNLGENARFHPSFAEPLRLYVNDFDDNGQIEQILTYYLGGQEVPFANFAEITNQMPELKRRYLLAKDFARAGLNELFGSEKLADSRVFEVNTLPSAWFENTGGGLAFEMHPLPDRLQFSALKAALAADFDGKAGEEILLAGNFHECNIEMGCYDADYGNILHFGPEGKMTVSQLGSLAIKGQVRRMAPIRIGRKTYFILAKNDAPVQVIAPGGEAVQ